MKTIIAMWNLAIKGLIGNTVQICSGIPIKKVNATLAILVTLGTYNNVVMAVFILVNTDNPLTKVILFTI